MHSNLERKRTTESKATSGHFAIEDGTGSNR